MEFYRRQMKLEVLALDTNKQQFDKVNIVVPTSYKLAIAP